MSRRTEKKKKRKTSPKSAKRLYFEQKKKKLSRSLHLKPTLVCSFLTRKKKVEGLHSNAYKFYSKKKKECEKQVNDEKLFSERKFLKYFIKKHSTRVFFLNSLIISTQLFLTN